MSLSSFAYISLLLFSYHYLTDLYLTVLFPYLTFYSQLVTSSQVILFCLDICFLWGFPGGLMVKESTCNSEDAGGAGSIPGSGNPLEEGMATTPLFLPGESHGQRSLAGYIVHRVAKSWTRLK